MRQISELQRTLGSLGVVLEPPQDGDAMVRVPAILTS
jgi:hypothetical protein